MAAMVCKHRLPAPGAERGQEMVEFAFALPFLLLILMLGVELLRMVTVQVALNETAAAVVAEAAKLPTISDDPSSSDYIVTALYDRAVATNGPVEQGALFGTEMQLDEAWIQSAPYGLDGEGKYESYTYHTSLGGVKVKRARTVVSAHVEADLEWVTPIGGIFNLFSDSDIEDSLHMSSETYAVICDITSNADWGAGAEG